MTTMTKEKSNNQSLKAVLGAEAYLEYKSDNDAIISKQTKIADRQVEIITQRVEDKFERRLIEETTKIKDVIHALESRVSDKIEKVNDKIEKVNDKIDSQLKWMLTFMISQTSLIIAAIYFLNK
jgi:hypothetical protein